MLHRRAALLPETNPCHRRATSYFQSQFAAEVLIQEDGGWAQVGPGEHGGERDVAVLTVVARACAARRTFCIFLSKPYDKPKRWALLSFVLCITGKLRLTASGGSLVHPGSDQVLGLPEPMTASIRHPLPGLVCPPCLLWQLGGQMVSDYRDRVPPKMSRA